MPDIILLGSAEKILALEPEENPAESFPCMPCAAIDKTVRSQLYAYLAGIFYDDAQAMEILVGESGPGGPFIYRLDEALVTRLAETDEDRVPEIVKWWSGRGGNGRPRLLRRRSGRDAVGLSVRPDLPLPQSLSGTGTRHLHLHRRIEPPIHRRCLKQPDHRNRPTCQCPTSSARPASGGRVLRHFLAAMRISTGIPERRSEEKSFVFVDEFVRQVEGAAGSNSRVCCVELGFGFGINCLLTCGYWQESRPAARLDYISIEKHPVPRQELSRLLSGLKLPLANTLVDNWPVPLAGMHVIWLTRNIRLLLILEDVHHALAELEARVDAWYLDGFSPASNAAMWADNLYRRMFTKSAPGARVTTYTAAGRVRRGLGAAGFHVRKVKGFGGKHEMLVAERPGNWTPGTLDPRRVAIIGGGLAGHFCAEAFARRGLNPTLVDNGRVNPSQVPQLAVFPQLAVRPEPRYRFSLLAHQYMLPCPGFEATGVAFFPRNADEVGRLQRIAAQFSSNFIEWRGSHLWFESGGWWSLGSFLQPTVFETIMADISSIRHRDQGWRLYTGAREVTRADVVILATGPDRRLAGKEPEIRSVRGQAISLATEGIACVTTGPVSIFPTANGRSTIAGTYSRHTRGTDMQASADDTRMVACRRRKPDAYHRQGYQYPCGPAVCVKGPATHRRSGTEPGRPGAVPMHRLCIERGNPRAPLRRTSRQQNSG